MDLLYLNKKLFYSSITPTVQCREASSSFFRFVVSLCVRCCVVSLLPVQLLALCMHVLVWKCMRWHIYQVSVVALFVILFDFFFITYESFSSFSSSCIHFTPSLAGLAFDASFLMAFGVQKCLVVLSFWGNGSALVPLDVGGSGYLLFDIGAEKSSGHVDRSSGHGSLQFG